jgi:leucyl/phenylalanyl-tRNA--protein transferase
MLSQKLLRVPVPYLGPEDPFPPVDEALDEPDGLLAAGGELSVKRLVDAYSRGIFPWFNDGDPILWWSPDPRMVLRPLEFRVSRSLTKRLRQPGIVVTADTAFDAVVSACAAPRRDDHGTWLVPAMRRAYRELHRAGYAHSVEVWMDGALAGGLYGVAIGRMFFGESMFSARTDGSKVAMAHLTKHLAALGVPLIDCQLETDHLASLGATLIPRAQFTRELEPLVRAEPLPRVWSFHAEAP